MQRIILGLEASRSSDLSSEFVTKRLCCSFILSVAFFAVIGGFFLGRFTSESKLEKMKTEITEEISRKLLALDKNLKTTFHDGFSHANCSISKINCEHFKSLPKESSIRSIKEIVDILDVINNCFKYG